MAVGGCSGGRTVPLPTQGATPRGPSTPSTSASRSTSAAPSPSAATPARPGALTLADRVVGFGEFPGFAPTNPTSVVRGAGAWVAAQGLPAAQASAEVARLHRVGFVAGGVEQLAGPAGSGDRSALSMVEQLGSAADARRELAQNSRPPAGQGAYAAFSVPAIPGARGFDASGGGGAGHNVAFADGPYYYLVGAGFAIGASNPPSRAQVVAAATALYRRVHARSSR